MNLLSNPRLSGLKAGACSGLTLSLASHPRLERRGLASANGSFVPTRAARLPAGLAGSPPLQADGQDSVFETGPGPLGGDGRRKDDDAPEASIRPLEAEEAGARRQGRLTFDAPDLEPVPAQDDFDVLPRDAGELGLDRKSVV